MEPKPYMEEDFGLSQAPVLLIYLGDGWLILLHQHGNQNPGVTLTCTTVTPLGCLFIYKIRLSGF